MTLISESTLDQEVAILRRDGIVVMPGLLPIEAVLAAQSAWRALKTEIAEGRSDLVRSARFVSGGWLPPAIDKLPQQPGLVAMAKAFLGPDVALYMNRLLVKDDIWSGPVAAHQDFPYFHGGILKMSAFIPLEPFTEATGNLKFIIGSQRYGNLGRGTIRHEDFPPMPTIAPDAHPGDAIVTDFLIWHYSDGPTAVSDRPLLQITYQAADDGSYFGEPAEPRLIAGSWKTDYFHRAGQGITPDG